MRISDWSSDVCSSDLSRKAIGETGGARQLRPRGSSMTTGRGMRRRTVAALAMCAALGLELGTATAQTRIKDIVDFEGVRENMLIGYGLVVGLNGTGDDLDGAIFTRESLVGMLERLGVNARDEDQIGRAHV